MLLIVLFSGRRRHAGFTGGWSSVVCSSDLRVERPIVDNGLSLQEAPPDPVKRGKREHLAPLPHHSLVARGPGRVWTSVDKRTLIARLTHSYQVDVLSEERRGGKEC